MSHAAITPRRDTPSVRQQREKLITVLFPTGVPRLWCPTLTHFRAKFPDAGYLHCPTEAAELRITDG